MQKLILAALLLCLLVTPALAANEFDNEFVQQDKIAQKKEAMVKLDNQYLDMAKQAARDPSGAKWDSLRILYIQSRYYRQANGAFWSRMEAAGRLAMKTSRPGDVEIFDTMLKEQYADFRAHVLAIKLAGAGASFIDIGQEQAALDALSTTITSHGDGRSKEKAFVIMMAQEVNLIVENYFGYKLLGLRRSVEAGHTYDIASWKNAANGKTGSIWFNVDIIVENK
ncbi:MAG: hypothetical protein ACAH80_07800 [Alphaproteobacteria bacterium]